MAAKPFYTDPVTKLPIEIESPVTSAGAGDAGKIPALDSSGKLDQSFMPPGVGADTKVIQASEALAAGDYVNIHDVSGSARIRKADASAAGATKRAHGFVLDNVSSGANGAVYFEGDNTAVTGLTSGLTYVLSHTVPGGVVVQSSGTSTAGHILQELGSASSATSLNTEIGLPLIRG